MPDMARSQITASMASDEVDLSDTSSLLASRICHDLISPVGAISNGFELLAMSGLPASPELALIKESIENANARIRLFRLAFGAANSKQMMARGDVIKVLQDNYGSGRISVKWDSLSDVSRLDAKLALLSVLCMESVLPAGGEILIQENRGVWQIQAFGTKIRFDADVWGILMGRAATEDVAAAQVQYLLLGDALTQSGKDPLVGHSDTAVSLRY